MLMQMYTWYVRVHRWLILNGKAEEARSNLKKLTNGNDDLVDEKVTEIKESFVSTKGLAQECKLLFEWKKFKM